VAADEVDALGASVSSMMERKVEGAETYEQGTGEPEDGGEEDECYISLPALAGAGFGDIAPFEDGAAVKWANELSNC
jgi:hypothetical protein